MIHFHVITLFPDVVDSYVRESILGRGIKNKKIKVSFYNPRDFTKDRHRRVDERPYGGGPGMVLRPEPLLRAITSARGRKKNVKTLFLSASGKSFNEAYAKRLSKNYKEIILISGHYEGIDERVRKISKAEEISVGPYVLTGGEVPAMAVIDAVSRFIPGVLGKQESLESERISSSEVYTRPEVLIWRNKKYKVPKILLSGHHKNIENWKKQSRA